MKIQPPYDFQRTLYVINRFSVFGSPSSEPRPDRLQIGVRIHDQPVVVTIRSLPGRPEELDVTVSASLPPADLEALARWVLFAELDLAPFYRLIEPHPLLAPVLHALWGVKPVRPASLFEMSVTVITEQQISLVAANRIRSRLTERFGEQVAGVWVFPAAVTLAQAPLEEIVACGYSHRKAEYIRDFSAQVAAGSLDLEEMKTLPETVIYQRLLGLRGWGPWSADYFLIRGLARPDSLPSTDLAVRSVVGKYLGGGPRPGATQVEQLLEPFRPYRGILAFYLLAYDRLEK
jgi:DNA-3-methyladenine glycosylase II